MVDSNNIEIMRENIRDLMIDDLSNRREVSEIKTNLGDPEEAEGVEGESAFSKISAINNKIDKTVNGNSYSTNTVLDTNSTFNGTLLKRKTINITRSDETTQLDIGIYYKEIVQIEGFANGNSFRVPISYKDNSTFVSVYVAGTSMFFISSSNITDAYITITYAG